MRGRALGWARFVVGVGCVVVAVGLLFRDVPRQARGAEEELKAYAYITSPQTRLLTTGDALDIPYALQVEALTLIPRSSGYAVLLPATLAQATRDGMNPITYMTVAPWLRYLLLPSVPISPAHARYVVCWECDIGTLRRRVRWLWQAAPGMAIGEVEY